MSGGPSWRLDHDPFARPLGCNGQYGGSGAQQHRRDGTSVCEACRESQAHKARESRRGGLRPHKLQPCGTFAAAKRHRVKKEPLDLACRVAEAAHQANRRAKAKEPTHV